jgi:hypothetical protein
MFFWFNDNVLHKISLYIYNALAIYPVDKRKPAEAGPEFLLRGISYPKQRLGC